MDVYQVKFIENDGNICDLTIENDLEEEKGTR